MYSSYLFIVILLVIIIVLLLIILFQKNANSTVQNDEEKSTNTQMIQKSEQHFPSMNDIQMSDVTEIVLQNTLGQELVIQRSSELEDVNYKEVDLDGTGNIILHAGQGTADVIALSELNSIANTTLFTSDVPLDELISNYRYNNGKFSSIQFRSSDGKGIKVHKGYELFDSSSAAGAVPLMTIAAAMQGMAIVSGQYFLKQINASLKSIGKDIEELKEIHESSTRGTLTYCRKRLMQISGMQHCSKEDIIEIRDLANKAGVIREQYRERYEKALSEVEQFRFDSLIVDVALDEYNKMILKVRYLLQICMVADRIVDEAMLTEFITRRKIDINDPALSDVYTLMEDNYQNGFNASINKDMGKITGIITEKGREYLGDFYSPASTDILLSLTKKCSDEIGSDIVNITNCVRRIIENQNKQERIAILFNEDGKRPRFFVEAHENTDKAGEV